MLDFIDDDKLIKIKEIPESPYYRNLLEQIFGIVFELDIKPNEMILDIGSGSAPSLSNGLSILLDCTIVSVDKQINYQSQTTKHITIQDDFFSHKFKLDYFGYLLWVSPYIGEAWFDGRFENFISKIAQSLKKGGKFLFDTFDFARYDIGQTIVKRRLQSFTQLTRVSQDRIDGVRVLSSGKKIDLSWRVFTSLELENIFAQSDLKLIKKLDSFGQNLPPEYKNKINYTYIPRDIYIFEKK